jgi:hypothetical protein
VRLLALAFAVSLTAHVAIVEWLARYCLRRAPIATAIALPAPAQAPVVAAPPIDVAIVALDAAPREPVHHAIAGGSPAAPGRASAESAPQSGPSTPAEPSLLRMRRAGTDVPPPAEVVDHGPPRDAPAADREELPDEKLRRELDDARQAGDWQRVQDLRDQQRQLDLQPSGGGTYRATQPGFDVGVDRDGMVHVHDKPTFDLTDALMRAAGIDPYSSQKLRVLDRTRDARAILFKRARRELLAKSADLVQRQMQLLWAQTTDLAERKEGLFELWDDCAETGDPELLAGAQAARAMVIGWIRSELRDGLAYTAAELAAFNRRRRSAQVFDPYSDSDR